MPLSLLQYTRDTSPKLTTKTVELGHALPVQGSRYVTKDRVKRARSTATSSACHVHPSERAVRAAGLTQISCAIFYWFGEAYWFLRRIKDLHYRRTLNPH